MAKNKLLQSELLMHRAQSVMPGGVNSPVRAFKSVGGSAIFFKRGSGPNLFDVDGNSYIDYVCSWGALILGHANPHVIQVIENSLKNGLSFGASCEAEVELAELICKIMPSIEMLRMTSSGTEATMSALRLARGFTGKNKILKFDDCYHGHSDALLVKAGSGILTFGIAGSAGVPADIAQHTLVAPYNDLNASKEIFAKYGHDIAAIIVEPIAANMNLIMPMPEFLPGLRTLCDQYNSLLIFDEVITGFRVSLGGAQELYNIKPDLTCLGKIIGGGMPVGAFGGRAEILSMLAPIGPVYQAGTLSGNPITMSSGLVTLQALQEPGIYRHLNQATKFLMTNFAQLASKYDIDITVKQIAGLFGFVFNNDFKQQIFNKFFHLMLEQGVYLAPSAFEASFISLAHDEKILMQTIEAADLCFAKLSLTTGTKKSISLSND